MLMELVILLLCIAGKNTNTLLCNIIYLKLGTSNNDFINFSHRNALFALHQKYVMNAGGVLVNSEGRKLSRMASPATPKEVNNNLDEEEIETSTTEIICEIAPKVSYAGEGLEEHVKGKRFKIPAINIGEN